MEIVHLLHAPGTLSSWTGKARNQALIQTSHMWQGAACQGSCSAAFPGHEQRAGSEVGQVRLESAPTGDAGFACSSAVCCLTTLAQCNTVKWQNTV